MLHLLLILSTFSPADSAITLASRALAAGNAWEATRLLAPVLAQPRISAGACSFHFRFSPWAGGGNRSKALALIAAIALGAISVRLLHTPGHTPGSQCFLVDGRLVSGAQPLEARGLTINCPTISI